MEFRNKALFISIMIGIAIFLFLIVVISAVYNNAIKNTRYARNNPKEWLFYKFNDKLYEAFFGRKDEDEVAVRLGIKVEDYYKNCELIKETPNVKDLIIKYIYGIIILILSVFAGILFNPLFVLFGLCAFYCFTLIPAERVKSKAQDMRQQVESELPQFLDLLCTELEIGLPIDTAIEVLSRKYDGLLSQEFLEALNDAKLGGAGGWQAAIEKVATKYEIEILSDFVLDIIVAFNKGISVAKSVKDKTRSIKQKHTYSVKERAGRSENIILLPITLLQFVPMLVFMLLPSLATVSGL